jgi:uncharacterized protein
LFAFPVGDLGPDNKPVLRPDKFFNPIKFKDNHVAETNVKILIKKLIALQKIDGQAFQIKKDLRDKPGLLKELTLQFDGKKTRLRELEDRSRSAQVAAKTMEGELKSQEDVIAKTNSQLSLLKTNREYQAMMTEIEGMKAKKSQIEEKLLSAFDEVDGLKKQAEEEKAALAKDEAQYQQDRQTIEVDIKVGEEKLRALTAQRSQYLEGIDRATLSRYEKILAGKEGLAIVPLQNGSCGGCFMNMPQQVINDIRMHERLIYCEMCARILFLEDDLEK